MKNNPRMNACVRSSHLRSINGPYLVHLHCTPALVVLSSTAARFFSVIFSSLPLRICLPSICCNRLQFCKSIFKLRDDVAFSVQDLWKFTEWVRRMYLPFWSGRVPKGKWVHFVQANGKAGRKFHIMLEKLVSWKLRTLAGTFIESRHTSIWWKINSAAVLAQPRRRWDALVRGLAAAMRNFHSRFRGHADQVEENPTQIQFFVRLTQASSIHFFSLLLFNLTLCWAVVSMSFSLLQMICRFLPQW